MVDNIKDTLVRRDGISEEEAQEQVDMVTADVSEAIETAGSLEEIEDIIMNDLGLEPDYLEEILFGLM
jgi:TPP-dependent pyruvate/acetoin dehydrogenase alpha subunit